jgi:hypothetical protein
MIAQRVEQRRGRRRLPVGGIAQPAPQHPTGDAREQSQQEGQAPAPVVEGGGRQDRRQQGGGSRAQQDAENPARRGDGADQAAAVRRCLFDQEDEGGGPLAAGRQPLQAAQQGEQDGCRHAQHRMAGQQADQERRPGHGHDGENERRAPAMTIADMADQRAAQRAHEIARSEHAKGRQHLGHRVGVGKEGAADLRREIAVDREVVPFEQVADGPRRQHAPPAVARRLCHRPESPLSIMMNISHTASPPRTAAMVVLTRRQRLRRAITHSS